jgi:hypothetical protein
MIIHAISNRHDLRMLFCLPSKNEAVRRADFADNIETKGV